MQRQLPCAPPCAAVNELCRAVSILGLSCMQRRECADTFPCCCRRIVERSSIGKSASLNSEMRSSSRASLIFHVIISAIRAIPMTDAPSERCDAFSNPRSSKQAYRERRTIDDGKQRSSKRHADGKHQNGGETSRFGHRIAPGFPTTAVRQPTARVINGSLPGLRR